MILTAECERPVSSAELLAESVWWRLSGSRSETEAPGARAHVWGAPLYLGVALVKLRHPATGPARLQGMLDVLRAEWSPPLADFLAHAAM